MSVASTNPVVSELGNGVKTDFDFVFKVFLATEVKVYVETAVGSGLYAQKTYTIDYTVTFNTANETGTVIFAVAPATGRKVYITRAISATQGSTLPLEGKMPSKVVEDALDKLTLLVQDAIGLLSLPFTPPAEAEPTEVTGNVVQYLEGLYSAKPAAPVVWVQYYSTDLDQLEQWVPDAGKWFLIG